MSPEAALLARIAACGLNPDEIAIRFESDLQSEVVALGSASGVSEAHFECLWNAGRGSFFEFSDRIIGSKYDEFAERKAKDWMQAEATRWLKAHNKYEGAPVYATGSDLKGWTIQVEIFCGFEPGEAFELLGLKQLTMKPIGLEAISDPRRACLFYVVSLSDLKAAGIQYGFIGNEAYVDDAK